MGKGSWQRLGGAVPPRRFSVFARQCMVRLPQRKIIMIARRFPRVMPSHIPVTPWEKCMAKSHEKRAEV